MAIGDVGQSAREEIDFFSKGKAARARTSAGARARAASRTRSTRTSSAPGAFNPQFDYTHADGSCSITGGYVVRDKTVPGLRRPLRVRRLLQGRPLLGSSSPTRARRRTAATSACSVASLISFGEDAAGHVYAVSQDGSVYRLVAKSMPARPRRRARPRRQPQPVHARGHEHVGRRPRPGVGRRSRAAARRRTSPPWSTRPTRRGRARRHRAHPRPRRPRQAPSSGCARPRPGSATATATAATRELVPIFAARGTRRLRHDPGARSPSSRPRATRPTTSCYVLDDGAAFTGDAVLGRGSVFVARPPLGAYLDGLRRLRALPLDLAAVPATGRRRRRRRTRSSTSTSRTASTASGGSLAALDEGAAHRRRAARPARGATRRRTLRCAATRHARRPPREARRRGPAARRFGRLPGWLADRRLTG